MQAYRMGEAAELVGVSVDTLRRWAEAGKVRTTRTRGGQRMVPAPEVARLTTKTTSPRRAMVIVGQSARNRFPGVVTKVTKDGVMAQVEIQAGPHRVVSLMSREAADELGLAPGVAAVAAIKATNVVVELPK